ncbi:D-aspartate oxidase [Ctenocephalides felis]|uniref:D-aspartate oxidase n=1 Tax=Ctenocephalides felis TaxID=7515 RepID=UPI000E6E135C|nr:D-aspartate oxidase [Ctenocephalides felis]
MKICVVGAGVIGLTTALELQSTYRGADIHILSNKFENQTTSYVAAGLFRPGTSFCGPTDEITRQIINDSYYYWDSIRKTSEAAEAGVTQLSVYIFSSKSAHITRNSYIEKLVPIYRAATEDELQLCPGNWKYGSFFTTLLTECRLYLPWAKQKFLSNGGHITEYTINNFADLPEKYDIVVNCTGLQAKILCNDNKLVPIRGQVIKVKAPWIKTAFYGDYDTYVIPGFETVTLGGVRQYDSYNTEICKYDRAAIKERCESLVPSLKTAKVVNELVGLRPHRDPVRIEGEVLRRGTESVKIVHNLWTRWLWGNYSTR